MSYINRGLIVECLRELGSKEFQNRVWRSSGGMVSSFSEAVEQLFTDSGLSEKLEGRSTGFGSEVEDVLVLLDRQLSKINRNQPVEMLINDPAMEDVRALANRALGGMGGI